MPRDSSQGMSVEIECVSLDVLVQTVREMVHQNPGAKVTCCDDPPRRTYGFLVRPKNAGEILVWVPASVAHQDSRWDLLKEAASRQRFAVELSRLPVVVPPRDRWTRLLKDEDI